MSYKKLIAVFVIILPMFTGYMGYTSGQTVEYSRTEQKRITFVRYVEHKERYHKFIEGELYNWDKSQRLSGKETLKIAGLK